MQVSSSCGVTLSPSLLSTLYSSRVFCSASFPDVAPELLLHPSHDAMFPFSALYFISQVAIAILAYATLRILYQIVHYRFFHPLSAFPGPFWASVTRLWIAYHDFKGDERFFLWDEVQKHGKPLGFVGSFFVLKRFRTLHWGETRK